ncbi:MAG: alpha/beta hydrolase [Ilumatobacteraceae bacterium]
MATLEVDGATVGYAVEGPADGSGIPLLLFHGTTMDRTAWDMVRAGFPTDTYRCVLIEFPGSGESSMPTEPLSVDGLVAQALAVMDALGHDTFHVGGYSLGAVIALATAAAAPDRVTSLTSLCGWAATDARMRHTFDLWKRLIATDKELFMRYAMADGFTLGALTIAEPMIDVMLPITAGLVQPGSAAQLDLDIVVDIAERLASITAKTLVIGAVEDRWVDISHSRTLAGAIAGATLVELPAGHLVIQELAVDVANLMREHISGS